MLTLTSAELNAWIASILWPLTRILGMIAAAPVIGNQSVPVRVKVGLGIMLTIIVAPTIPATPASDIMSLAGFTIILRELLIGLAMGFVMRVAFAAVEMAGEISGLTMGFGFATFFDPQTRAHTSAIAQFLALMALLVFLGTNIHLMMLATLAESFVLLPVSPSGLSTEGFRSIAGWGAAIWSTGLQLALPIVAVLLVANIALAVLTRAAPQLNLFGIGFPVTLGAGFIVLTLALPYLADPMEHLFADGLDRIRTLLGYR